jgi:hypothetical protein
MMSRVKLEDERIVDLVLIPQTAVEAEQRKKVQHQKVTSIDLHEISGLLSNYRVFVKQ